MKKITLNCFIQRKQLKLYLALMCSSLLISSCGGGAVKKEKMNDWVAMGLKGQVQKMTETKQKTVITMQFTYNDGQESQTSKPFDYTITEYTGDKLRLQVNGGSIITYDRKAKSMNYDGEY